MNLLAQASAESIVPDIAWSLLSPLLVIAIGGILLITITSVVPVLKGRGFPAGFTILTAAIAFALLRPLWTRVTDDGPQSIVGGALTIDHYAIFVWGVICVSVFLVGALLDGYLRRENLDGPEWYVLILMSASGGMILAAAQDLILGFLGLEILSIAVYVLAALHLRRSDSQEAAFKYFVLGALSSALFLYGIALVYGATGSTNLAGIAAARSDNAAGLNPLTDSSMMLVGMALVLVGFGFKVSAVPFHMWTPDVYQGSPTPVVAFMASAVKVAGFAGFVRVFWDGFGFYEADWRPVVVFLSALSLIVGSFLALAQTNVKRMLAYSSIAHAGFMLAAVQAVAVDNAVDSLRGAEALLFYMAAYTVMVAGTFGVITLVGGRGDGEHSIDDYVGLSRSQPVLAAMMAILLFAQAGIPFTSGFFAKFRVIYATAASGSYVLAGAAMLSAVVAAVLYLRIVVSMFLVSGPAVAHAATDAVDTDTADAADGAAIDGADADGGQDDGADGVGDDVEFHQRLTEVERFKPAMVAIALAAFATVLFGVFPGLGGDVLRAAAESLISLK